jgi:PhoD-like phosphatase
MTTTRRKFLKTAAAGAAGAAASSTIPIRKVRGASSFASAFPPDIERVFIGPEYWANRLQDWRLSGGRIECVESRPASPMRTLHLLTHRLSGASADFTISVRSEALAANVAADAATGFLIGAGGATMDYRAAALIHHQPGPGGGLFAGCDAKGQVFFYDFEKPQTKSASDPPLKNVRSEIALELTASPRGNRSELTLIARDNSGHELSRISQEFPNAKLTGNVALVSHPGKGDYAVRFRFRDWRLSGGRVEANPSGVCGPILGALYTVHTRTLKLTAQMAPVGLQENRTAELQIKRGREWKTIGAESINPSGWVAQFHIEKWDDRRDIPYRVRYLLKGPNRRAQAHFWIGTIKANPVNKDEIVVASLSCVQQINGAIGANQTYRWNYNVNFPHADLTPNLKKHDADLFFFAGDQVYEGNPTRVVREPQDEAELDYLYKWSLWHWAFGDVVRHAPCICIPDDHDVYHGNIWGDGGRAAAPDDPAGLQGGYGMPASWLNMMQRTQTSHLPDPYDPAPVAQGIGVYYTQLIWGGVGFAILEDRKFKSAPSIVKVEMTRDSHITQKDYDTRKADLPDAQLLGERQLKFLREFTRDWRGQQMKACLSQTIFCNLQISSRAPTTGELDKDLDSNGWPQSGRNAALRELRRGFMIHLAGDQHLASAMQHGIDEFGDACWTQCSPAIANLYTRFWNPDYPAVNPHPELKPFLGDYEDGFQNKITVRAVANPVDDPKPGQFPEPVELHRKATGYNIVRFNKAERTITLETWPRYVDPKTGRQYEGWPITIKQTDNYGRKAAAYLPPLKIIGMTDPVVQLVEEVSGEVLYTLRIKGDQFRPKVFARGKYSVNIGEPGTPKFKAITGVDAVEEFDSAILEVVLDGK